MEQPDQWQESLPIWGNSTDWSPRVPFNPNHPGSVKTDVFGTDIKLLVIYGSKTPTRTLYSRGEVVKGAFGGKGRADRVWTSSMIHKTDTHWAQPFLMHEPRQRKIPTFWSFSNVNMKLPWLRFPVPQTSPKELLLTPMTAEYFLIHNSCNW